MDRQQLEEGARRILLTNLRKGVADWNGKEFSFVVPSLRGYPFQWFWDSCFHAIALTHLDLGQARAELTTLMSAALPGGFIPHIIFWEMDKQPDFLSRNIVGMTSPNYSSTMQPPIIAYAVERVYQATGDEAFKEMALPILTGFYRWLRDNRDPDNDGLIAVIQPEEAGTDCSPKYDEALGLKELSNRGFIAALKQVYAAYEPMRGDDRRILAADIFHFEDVLVNSIYAFGLRSLVRLLGDEPEAEEFRREADRTRQALVAKCWDEEAGAFFDLSGVAEKPVKVVTISSLMPLILEDLPRPIVERLVGRWVTSADDFWLPYPLPSVPASSPKFMPGPSGNITIPTRRRGWGPAISGGLR
jgi:glycogen debranching enzyme